MMATTTNNSISVNPALRGTKVPCRFTVFLPASRPPPGHQSTNQHQQHAARFRRRNNVIRHAFVPSPTGGECVIPDPNRKARRARNLTDEYLTQINDPAEMISRIESTHIVVSV